MKHPSFWVKYASTHIGRVFWKRFGQKNRILTIYFCCFGTVWSVKMAFLACKMVFLSSYSQFVHLDTQNGSLSPFVCIIQDFHHNTYYGGHFWAREAEMSCFPCKMAFWSSYSQFVHVDTQNGSLSSFLCILKDWYQTGYYGGHFWARKAKTTFKKPQFFCMSKILTTKLGDKNETPKFLSQICINTHRKSVLKKIWSKE